jgi:hypothetical protein
MTNWSVEVENLTRLFGDFVAVDHVSFRVREGQIFGFLGPNGAGKSTTIRMLTGILAPSSGTGRIAGFDMITERRQIKKAIGYMSQKFSLYEDLTVRENLQFFGGIYGATAFDWAIQVCHLEPVLDTLQFPFRRPASTRGSRMRRGASAAHCFPRRTDSGRRPGIPAVILGTDLHAGSGRSHCLCIDALHGRGRTLRLARAHRWWKDRGIGIPADLRRKNFDARLLELDVETMFAWIDDLERSLESGKSPCTETNCI